MFKSKIFNYIFPSLKNYKKEYWSKDIVAGIVVASLTIPVAMGYAEVAGLPPIFGLYAAIFPIIAYAMFSSSPQLNLGANASSSAITASALASMGIALSSNQVLYIVPVLSFFCAIFLLLFAIANLGKFTKFISMPVMSGFITGVALSILFGQIPKMMGISADRSLFMGNIIAIITGFSKTNWFAVAIGVTVLALIIIGKKTVKKVPVSLILLVVATIASSALKFDEYGVKLIGDIPKGLPSFNIPDIFALPNLALGVLSGFLVALVCFADSLLSSKSFAIRNHYELDEQRELAAYSVANFAAAVTGCAPVGASVSRTAASEDFKGKTQLVSVVAAVIVGLVVAFFSPLLYYMPDPALAGITISALLGIIDVKGIRSILSRSKREAAIWTAAVLGVLLVGVLFGVLLGVFLSFIDVIARLSAPPSAMLGKIEGKRGYYDLQRNPEARPLPHVAIYRFSGALFFANVKDFSDGLENALSEETEILIIDASAIISIDITAADELIKVVNMLEKKKIKYYITNGIGTFRDELERMELSSKISGEHIQKTIQDALNAGGYTEEKAKPQ